MESSGIEFSDEQLLRTREEIRVVCEINIRDIYPDNLMDLQLFSEQGNKSILDTEQIHD